MNRTVQTKIEIAASPAALWNALVDFSCYPQWNPFLRSVRGEARPGERLALRVCAPDSPSVAMNAEVRTVEPNRELSWTCYWLSPRLLAGDHRFVLEIQGPRKVLLHHGETFQGLLVPCLWPLMEPRCRRGLEAMNAALKKRAESGQR
ncbi:Polyketide cyclase [Methylacidimicrobium sp. AP8]|uniref:SRPBCC domain-containing protein n=1 Tax=Methylacidimicrobium sp. AP8 TaxID=2730359 RepID=UPI0018BFE3F4|nr:SRPBCC domain-containing protein [Methylacidimicrobium sp. AP8]CAB4243183.1 Polyketide cyclase [Methylacidimicrobium sp. AP8]